MDRNENARGTSTDVFIAEIDSDGNLPKTTETTRTDFSESSSLVPLSMPAKVNADGTVVDDGGTFSTDKNQNTDNQNSNAGNDQNNDSGSNPNDKGDTTDNDGDGNNNPNSEVDTSDNDGGNNPEGNTANNNDQQNNGGGNGNGGKNNDKDAASTASLEPSHSRSKGDELAHVLVVTISVILAAAILCSVLYFIASHNRKKRQEVERAMVFSYIQPFDLEDIDIKQAATGGYHGTYMGKLAEEIGRAHV